MIDDCCVLMVDLWGALWFLCIWLVRGGCALGKGINHRGTETQSREVVVWERVV